MAQKPVVAILMGSQNDLPVVQNSFKILKDFGVKFEAHVMSAHRTPADACKFAKNAEANGFKVIICVAGMAAHLSGVVAAHTILPVIGLPMASEPFGGMDALLISHKHSFLLALATCCEARAYAAFGYNWLIPRSI